MSMHKYPSKMFTARTPNDPISDHRKFNICVPKSQGLSKLWVAGLILCFILCITVISIAIWAVSLLRENQGNNIDLDFGPSSKHTEEYVGMKHFFDHDTNHVDSSSDEKNYDLFGGKWNGKVTEEVLSENLFENSKEYTHNVDAVMQNIPKDSKTDAIPKNHKADYAQNDRPAESAILVKDGIKLINEINNAKTMSRNISSPTPKANQKKPENSYKTQISSPDAIIAQVTTDLLRVNDHLLHPEQESNANKMDSKTKRKIISNEDKDTKDPVQNDSQTFIANLAGYLSIFGTEHENRENAYPDPDFYSEADAQVFYYDYEKITWAGYLLEKIQELYDWVTTDLELNDGKFSKGNENAPLPQILKALNQTIIKGDASILLVKLRDLYFSENGTEFDPEKSRKMLTNTTSVVSFGLLALDVVLLRNIQIISWEDQITADKEMTKDIEVFALNSIFMDRNKVKKMYREFQAKSRFSAYDTERWERISSMKQTNDLQKNNKDEDEQLNINIAEEFIQFITSTFRAVLHLGEAFRNARAQLQIESSKKRVQIRGRESPIETNRTEIDCIWTLYCRNLNKATKLGSTSGILAKLNSIGLRLILGEVKIERILESVIEETLTDAKPLNCEKMFPKCSPDDAPRIIIEEIIKDK